MPRSVSGRPPVIGLVTNLRRGRWGVADGGLSLHGREWLARRHALNARPDDINLNWLLVAGCVDAGVSALPLGMDLNAEFVGDGVDIPCC